MTKDDSISQRIQDLPFFHGLTERDILFLKKNSEVRDYPRGKTLFLAGDAATRLFTVVSGWVKLYRVTAEGEEAVFETSTAGDIFGETAIFVDACYSFCAEMAEDTCLLEISGAALRECAQSNPGILMRVMESLARAMRKLQLENEHLAIMTAPQRVGCLLLQISSDLDGTGGVFTFPYDKSLAASRLGMKPETFSRALAQLKPHGVDVKGAQIRIDNFQSLVEYICIHCSSQEGECRGSRGCGGTCECSGCAGCGDRGRCPA